MEANTRNVKMMVKISILPESDWKHGGEYRLWILRHDDNHDSEVREPREAQKKFAKLFLVFNSEAGSHDKLSLDMPVPSGGAPDNARTEVTQSICVDFGYLDSVVGRYCIGSDRRLRAL